MGQVAPPAAAMAHHAAAAALSLKAGRLGAAGAALEASPSGASGAGPWPMRWTLRARQWHQRGGAHGGAAGLAAAHGTGAAVAWPATAAASRNQTSMVKRRQVPTMVESPPRLRLLANRPAAGAFGARHRRGGLDTDKDWSSNPQLYRQMYASHPYQIVCWLRFPVPAPSPIFPTNRLARFRPPRLAHLPRNGEPVPGTAVDALRHCRGVAETGVARARHPVGRWAGVGVIYPRTADRAACVGGGRRFHGLVTVHAI